MNGIIILPPTKNSKKTNGKMRDLFCFPISAGNQRSAGSGQILGQYIVHLHGGADGELADGIHADMQDFRFPQILVILGGIYSPSEVSDINGNSVRLKLISQLWDYKLLDIVSLRMHIAERTAEEDIDMSMLHRLSDSFVLREYTKNGIEIDKFPAVFEN